MTKTRREGGDGRSRLAATAGRAAKKGAKAYGAVKGAKVVGRPVVKVAAIPVTVAGGVVRLAQAQEQRRFGQQRRRRGRPPARPGGQREQRLAARRRRRPDRRQRLLAAARSPGRSHARLPAWRCSSSCCASPVPSSIARARWQAGRHAQPLMDGSPTLRRPRRPVGRRRPRGPRVEADSAQAVRDARARPVERDAPARRLDRALDDPARRAPGLGRGAARAQSSVRLHARHQVGVGREAQLRAGPRSRRASCAAARPCAPVRTRARSSSSPHARGLAQRAEDLDDRRLDAGADVVGAVGLGVGGGGEVGRDDVADVGVVARLAPVAEDDRASRRPGSCRRRWR